MAAHIAVVDPLPMFQQGVAGILAAAGHTVQLPEGAHGWVPPDDCSLVLWTLHSENDWEQFRRLHRLRPGLRTIAIVDDESVAVCLRAVRTGARSVLPRRATAAALTRAVDAAIDGQAVLPAAVVTALAAADASRGTARQVLVSAEQLAWLRQLAAGVTVARLATDVGYSERAMYRLLRSLYQTMGVHNRVQAILLAQEHGWLAGEDMTPR